VYCAVCTQIMSSRISISGICELEKTTIVQLHALLTVFLHPNPHLPAVSVIRGQRTKYEKLLRNAPGISSVQALCKNEDSKYFCFDGKERFVCFRDQLSLKKHNITLPQTISNQINQPSSRDKTSKISFEDEIVLLSQYCNNHELGVFELKWNLLCMPQMKSVAAYLEVSFTDEQLANCVNPRNLIKAKCRAARNFRGNYGNATKFDYALFAFSVENIFSVEGLSVEVPEPKKLTNHPITSKVGRTPSHENDVSDVLPKHKSDTKKTKRSSVKKLDSNADVSAFQPKLPASVKLHNKKQKEKTSALTKSTTPEELLESKTKELPWPQLSKEQRISVLKKLGIITSSSLTEVEMRAKLLKNFAFQHQYLNSDFGLKGTLFVFTAKNPGKCANIKTPTSRPKRAKAIDIINEVEEKEEDNPSISPQPTSTAEQPASIEAETLRTLHIEPITQTGSGNTAETVVTPTEQHVPEIHIESITQDTGDASQKEKLTSTNSKHDYYEEISQNDLGSSESDQEEENNTQNGYDSVSKTETELTTHPPTKIKKRRKKKERTRQSGHKYKETPEAEEECWVGIDGNFKVYHVPSKDHMVNEDKCSICKNMCPEETLTCYLCKRTIHYSCYTSMETGGTTLKKSEFLFIQSSSNIDWKCRSCTDVTIEDITEAITVSIQTKVSELIKQMTDDTDEKINQIESHDSMKCDIIKKNMETIVSEHVGQMKKELSCQLMLLSNSLSYAEKIAEPQQRQNPQHPQINIAKSSAPINTLNGTIAGQGTPKRSPHHVDPSMSVIIRNVSCRKITSHDSYLKSEFNKHFNRMKIKHCKKTRYGNIILELTSKEDIKTVLEKWDPLWFTANDEAKGTEVLRMNDSRKNNPISHGVIKHVIQELSNEDIEKELQREGLHNIQAKRFIKEGRLLNSVKLTFTSNQDFERALSHGINIGRLHFAVNRYRYIQKPMQCHNCNKFGHPSRWCKSTQKCEYCSSKNHDGNSCEHKDTAARYACSNCHGNHTAMSTTCPTYQQILALISNRADD
jgi:hypothetical protein